MRNIFLPALACTMALLAAAAQAQTTPRQRLKPAYQVKPPPAVDTGRQLRKPLPVRGCLGPDPAVTKLEVARLRREGGGWVFDIYAQVRNLGQSAWTSAPGQQSLDVYLGHKRLTHIDFPSLAKGQERGVVTDQGRLPADTEFAPDVVAAINYDPDIVMDGNRENDDCNRGNNRKTYSSAELTRRLRAGH